jgi:REP element-mobilizing transposase RayT
MLYRNRYRVPSARWSSWDYRWAGVYSVTLCVQDRVRCLCDIQEGAVHLSRLGEIVAEEWQRLPHRFPHLSLDEWVIMPDHMHGILIFASSETPDDTPKSRLLAGSLGSVIGQFKSKSTKRIRAMGRRDFAWQARFHDRIVKTADHLHSLRTYIRENPRNWKGVNGEEEAR